MEDAIVESTHVICAGAGTGVTLSLFFLQEIITINKMIEMQAGRKMFFFHLNVFYR